MGKLLLLTPFLAVSFWSLFDTRLAVACHAGTIVAARMTTARVTAVAAGAHGGRAATAANVRHFAATLHCQELPSFCIAGPPKPDRSCTSVLAVDANSSENAACYSDTCCGMLLLFCFGVKCKSM
jgi:hypothetical protein